MRLIFILFCIAAVSSGCGAPVTVEGQDRVQDQKIFDLSTRYTVQKASNGLVQYSVFYTKGFQYFPDKKSTLAECRFQAKKIGEALALEYEIDQPKFTESTADGKRNIITGETYCEGIFSIQMS